MPISTGAAGTVGAAFAAMAWRHRNRPADLPASGVATTWAELAVEVRLLTCGLVDLGVAAGSVIGVRSDTGIGRRRSALAAAAAGLVVDLSDVGPAGAGGSGFVVRGVGVADEQLRARGRTLDEREPDAFERRLAGLPPESPAVVVGGRVFSHDALLWAARSFIQAVALVPDDRILTDLPIDDEVGLVVGHVAPLVVGAAAGLLPLVGSTAGRPTVLVVGGASPLLFGSSFDGRHGPRRTRRRWLTSVGLERCRTVVVVDGGDVSNLSGLGLPSVSVAARVDGVVGLVAMGEPEAPGDHGRPLPGTSIGIGTRREVLVRSMAAGGPGGWLATGRTGSLDPAGRLHLDHDRPGAAS